MGSLGTQHNWRTIGAIDGTAADLYRRFGPTNHPPGLYLFDNPPSDAEWQSPLAGQTRLTIRASEALNAVRDAWAPVVRTGDDQDG
jgi:hypothetical protein